MKRGIFLAVAAVAAALFVVSCTTIPRGFEAAEGKMVLPDYFLKSGSASFDRWLNEPFKVEFREKPFEELFRDEPLVGVSYRFEKLPRKLEPYTIDSPGMTRRQLLWAISRMYNLAMHVEYADRMPYGIVVTGLKRQQLQKSG